MRKRDILSPRLQQVAAFVTLPRIQKLLSTLVRMPSPSGEEASLQRFLETYLAQHGIHAERQQVMQGRYNLIARGGDRGRPGVLLNTHVDTVPVSGAGDYVPRRRGDYISGRGSCDAKGSVAAMLLAFVALRRLFAGEHVPVELCLTVGEESSGDGSQRFVKDCRRYEWAIVGEPTELRIMNCHAGFVEMILTASSLPGHAFEPPGEQAITAVAELMLEIRRRTRRRGKKPVHLFVHWIEGGNRGPYWSAGPTCKALLVVNTYSKAEVSSVIRLVRTCCVQVARKHRGVKMGVQIEDSDQGLQTPRNSPVVGFLSNSLLAIGRSRKITALPSWTDGARFCAAGIPTVVFGPGSLKDAHTDWEKVNLKDVRDASIAIAGAILSWHEQTAR